MSESFSLPITNIIQITTLAEPAVEGEEGAATDFSIEEVELGPLPEEEVAADLPTIAPTPPDRLQMLIEALSGITAALRQPPPEEEAQTAPAAPAQVTVALPDVEVRVVPTPAADPAPALSLVGEPVFDQVDPVAPDLAAPLTHTTREAGAALPDQPVHRVPVTVVARQIVEAVVTAREDQVEITLAPEELGRIRMVMSGPEHSPHVLIWAERPEVLDQLRRNATFLQECFGDAGMAEASFEFGGDGGTRDGSGDRQPLPDATRAGNDMTDIAPLPAAWTPMAIPARLDIRI